MLLRTIPRLRPLIIVLFLISTNLLLICHIFLSGDNGSVQKARGEHTQITHAKIVLDVDDLKSSNDSGFSSLCKTRKMFNIGVQTVVVISPLRPLALRSLAPCGDEGVLWALSRPDNQRLSICLWPRGVDKFISDSIYQSGMWDTELMVSMLRWLAMAGQGYPAIVIDAGANIGVLSLLAASYMHSVIAFEANTRNAALMLRSITLNKFGDRISLFRAALGERPGIGEMFTPTGNRGGSRLVINTLINPDPSVFKDEGSVQILTLDSVLPFLRDVVSRSRANVAALNPTSAFTQPPILMKLDVEGCEPLVLQGAQQLMNEFKVGAVFLEIAASIWTENGCSVTALAHAFFEKGYQGMVRGGAILRSEDDFLLWFSQSGGKTMDIAFFLGMT